MRITGGFLRSRRIDKKIPFGVRPSTDQSRETLFNILNNLIDLENSRFLDLFAGSGIVGLEAYSRGAQVTFVDKSFKCIGFIKEAFELLKINDLDIHKMDSISFLSTKEEFDVVFIDPPYDTVLYEKSIAALIENKNINDNGIVILELRSSRNIITNGFKTIKEKEIGSSKFIFLELP